MKFFTLKICVGSISSNKKSLHTTFLTIPYYPFLFWYSKATFCSKPKLFLVALTLDYVNYYKLSHLWPFLRLQNVNNYFFVLYIKNYFCFHNWNEIFSYTLSSKYLWKSCMMISQSNLTLAAKGKKKFFVPYGTRLIFLVKNLSEYRKNFQATIFGPPQTFLELLYILSGSSVGGSGWLLI